MTAREAVRLELLEKLRASMPEVSFNMDNLFGICAIHNVFISILLCQGDIKVSARGVSIPDTRRRMWVSIAKFGYDDPEFVEKIVSLVREVHKKL